VNRLRPASRWILLAAVLLGLSVPVLIAGGRALAPAWWRAPLLPIALGCVLAGLVEAAALGRDEWYRHRPTRARYIRTFMLFALAFGLVVGATG